MSVEFNQLFIEAENLGWSVEKIDQFEYCFSKFSPHGQDFSIAVGGECIEDILDNIYEEYENFDVSEETYLWLDDTGHGRNGAPYRMKDVLEDMEACEQMILDLYNDLNKYYND